MKHIFDSHAHYFDGRFERECESGASGILHDVLAESVECIINVGTNLQSSCLAMEQAVRYEGMYAAVGIHPEDCHYISDVDGALAQLKAMLGTSETRHRDKIVAIGEIGLDYHWQSYGDIPMDKEKQARFFDAQMCMAKESDLPVIIHDREAHGDCFETVLRHPECRGVFHSYSGSKEMALELIKRGWYISFSGTLTFKNAERVRDCARSLPRERVLVETDAPYLAPHPMRGKLNHSGLLLYTLEALGEVWKCSSEEAAIITNQNAKRLFAIL
ncbi:MAG: TatD family hydrolase [Clostridia bacterium]|nr:TatD family hydrolase [Clostridia bacterium]